jgi:hypothetical protein
MLRCVYCVNLKIEICKLIFIFTIGVVEKESPFTVRLLFEPSGRPKPDADYYTTVKQNVCVVCGSAESYVKKNIIPHDYRKYFPLEMKGHMSHDVLLMCLGCHRSLSILFIYSNSKKLSVYIRYQKELDHRMAI